MRGKLNELSTYFPANMEIVYPYDTTPFVKISIEEVVQTWWRRSSWCSA